MKHRAKGETRARVVRGVAVVGVVRGGGGWVVVVGTTRRLGSCRMEFEESAAVADTCPFASSCTADMNVNV